MNNDERNKRILNLKCLNDDFVYFIKSVITMNSPGWVDGEGRNITHWKYSHNNLTINPSIIKDHQKMISDNNLEIEILRRKRKIKNFLGELD